MLSDRIVSARVQGESLGSERRKRVPVLGWVPEDPDNVVGGVIDFDQEVLTARNDDGFIGGIVGTCVEMKPIHARANKLSRIIAMVLHVGCENIRHIKHLSWRLS